MRPGGTIEGIDRFVGAAASDLVEGLAVSKPVGFGARASK